MKRPESVMVLQEIMKPWIEKVARLGAGINRSFRHELTAGQPRRVNSRLWASELSRPEPSRLLRLGILADAAFIE